MAHKQTRPWSHSAFRHRSQIPMPAVAEVEQRRLDVLTPSLLAPRQLERQDPRQPQRLIRMRQRLLTLPVIVAIIVSLVWRRVPSIAEVQKVLAREGMLGVAPLQVSAQAITNRLDVLPAAVVGQLLAEVCARLHAHAPPALPHPSWEPVRQHFARLALVDGSTLEALRKTTQGLRERTGLVLGGKMLVMVEAFSHRPLWPLYTDDAAAHDQRFAAEILAALPVGGLLVFDLGFFSFLWFDDFTASDRVFVTRMREKTADRTVQELRRSPHSRDELIQVGQYRSNPGQPPLRMVSVLWPGVWYRYLTKVLDPQVLSARQVCELYRRRWRIEDAFALTTRLLDLAYVWTGSTHAVQLQI
jgi:Transposase DDE domain